MGEPQSVIGTASSDSSRWLLERFNPYSSGSVIGTYFRIKEDISSPMFQSLF